ncbi:DUF2147 domain-containing protein [Nitratireductor basaltis]|uniref:DUF2147 domain-containing protein n=1 Tax=Nitratireductor basaltis TaxID=472175 RepID=A0A084UCC4_9HYPH|nr:DUF2147 domain-containing protein [Nitratireductor basaltis]KFB10610.1 hypothetical protein EL18_01648 [Nitratireductor basaltis]
MIRKFMIATALVAMAAGSAMADPIEGNWRTQAGSTAQIASCGGSYCITLKSGKHAGRQIGKMSASGGGKYAGQITDPESDKTYKGKATLSGSSLKLGGCVLGGIICRNQTWNRL